MWRPWAPCVDATPVILASSSACPGASKRGRPGRGLVGIGSGGTESSTIVDALALSEQALQMCNGSELESGVTGAAIWRQLGSVLRSRE